MKRTPIALLIGLALFSVVSSGVGYTNVAAIFRLGTGARPLGMGGTFLALADDENATFYNPAGLGWIERFGVTSFFIQQFGAATFGALSVSLPYFGASLLQLDSGWIPAVRAGSAT